MRTIIIALLETFGVVVVLASLALWFILWPVTKLHNYLWCFIEWTIEVVDIIALKKAKNADE